MMFGYVVFREACLLWVVPKLVELNSPTTNWRLCHTEGANAIPQFAGC